VARVLQREAQRTSPPKTGYLTTQQYIWGHKVATNRLITRELTESSLWPHGVIAEKSSLVRERKPHIEKSGKMSITRNRTGSLAGDKNSHNITQSVMAKNRSTSRTDPL